ncbi:hypothetical protein ABC766_19285 [Methylobacterium fujisawaense]|uniref:hypothetical protein n=1 Tax=Methylobacterium fujisawaense TaxID=107400 RepID=UPI0031F56052
MPICSRLDQTEYALAMYRRDRDIDAAAYQADRYAWEPDDATWRADRDEPQRARKGFFGRLSSLIKVSVLAVPAALFLYGSFADCSGRPAAGWLGLVGAGACARNEMLGNVLSIQDNLALLKRLIN